MLFYLKQSVNEFIYIWQSQVHPRYLNVGHTHEEIDAAFSRISEKKTEAETVVGLIDLLPYSKHTGGLFDIKGWLEKHINTF